MFVLFAPDVLCFSDRRRCLTRRWCSSIGYLDQGRGGDERGPAQHQLEQEDSDFRLQSAGSLRGLGPEWVMFSRAPVALR